MKLHQLQVLPLHTQGPKQNQPLTGISSLHHGGCWPLRHLSLILVQLVLIPNCDVMKVELGLVMVSVLEVACVWTLCSALCVAPQLHRASVVVPNISCEVAPPKQMIVLHRRRRHLEVQDQ